MASANLPSTLWVSGEGAKDVIADWAFKIAPYSLVRLWLPYRPLPTKARRK
jgi:hypothetical protein